MYEFGRSRLAVISVAATALLTIAACSGQAPPAPLATPKTSSSSAGGPRYVDTHMHVVPTTPAFAAQGKPSPANQAGGFGAAADQLISLMDQTGVAKSVLVAVPGKEGREAEDESQLSAVVTEHPGRLYRMGGGAVLAGSLKSTPPDAASPEAIQAFEAQAQGIIDGGAIGFGEMISVHLCMSPKHSYQYVSPDHPLFLALADVAARNNVPMDIHLEALPAEVATPPNLLRACSQNPPTLPASIPALERLLSHNRDAKIVWQHAGWDNTGYRTAALTRSLLASHPNLNVALRVERRTTQVGTESDAMPNRIVDAAGKIDSEWLAVMNDYSDRFVVGADDFISPSGQTGTGSESWNQTWGIINQLPADLATRVGRDNAVRIYRLS